MELNSAERLVVLEAVDYWLVRWPNEDVNADLRVAREKLGEEGNGGLNG